MLPAIYISHEISSHINYFSIFFLAKEEKKEKETKEKVIAGSCDDDLFW